MKLYSYNGQLTNYQISETGKLFNTKTGKFLKGSVNSLGYLVYRVSINGLSKDLYAHRMVAETFIPNDDINKNCVNHKDGNKLNNSVSNLEWITKADNNRHACNNNLNPVYTSVYCYDKNKVFIAEYSSLMAAAKMVGGTSDVIGKAARAVKKNLTYGYFWNIEKNSSFETIAKIGGGRKPIAKYSLDNELIEKYETITEAARLNHFPRTRLSEAAYGNIKSYGGFIWKFL